MRLPIVKQDEKGIPTLYVHGRPFFCRAGELHNSSASDPAYLEEMVWPKLRGLNLNSVIAPVYWELIEPEQGAYRFDSVDGLIAGARREGLKLVLLWFGLWKNAESMYVPAWVKRDTQTYFRARTVSGEALPTVSPLCAAAVERDRLAFTALMEHLKETDGEENTVITIQVENEIGLLGTDRDYSPAAERAFAQAVPAALGKNGTWAEAYGADAGEAFMAWHFASAVETIAASGRAVYPLPCYANAWLRQYPWYPGSYPSGGPVREAHPIWKAAAPSLFALGPDVYVANCADVLDEYAYEGNPLFIPEIRKDAVAASYALYAFAGKNAISFSPFGIEDLGMDPAELDAPPPEVMAALNIDPSAFDMRNSSAALSAAYALLENLEPLYLQYRGTERIKAFVRHGELDFGAFLRFRDFDVCAAYGPRQSGTPMGAGVILELEDGRFLILGTRCTVSFRPKPGVQGKTDFLRLEEGSLDRGAWKPGRVLNGDEKMMIRFGDVPTAIMAEPYLY